MPTASSRPLPYVGMSVRIFHLAVIETGVVSAVADGGRTLIVDGHRSTLRRTNGRFVRADEPSYGVWLSLRPGPADPGP